ncbi:MAG: oxidoreductase [Chloroflexota bacterium]
MRVGIIGAGPAGLAAAYDLTRQGHHVVVYEAGPSVGGLASGFKAPHWDWRLERFYHHWFESDHDILHLIAEMGLSHKVIWPRPITAIYYQGKFYPFDSPMAVLRFPGLSWPDKLRVGLVVLYLRKTTNWQAFEQVTAHEWAQKWFGPRAYTALWEPLLVGKFGEENYREVNMAWLWARLYKRSPRLGTFIGGFQAFLDELAARVRRQGGDIRLNTPVQGVTPDGGRTTDGAGSPSLEIHTSDGTETFDAVISTASPRLMAKLVPALPESYASQLKRLKSLGAVVLILALDRQLTPGIYWHNLPKSAGFPFLALVEHTNYVKPEYYGGDHLVYCGDYLPPEHPYFKMTQEELLATFLPALVRFNPAFEPGWVKQSWLFRTEYAQPVPPVNYSQMIPDVRTPIPGLYFASMSQVYPWDRGTNYAVEIGRRVARLVVEDAARQNGYSFDGRQRTKDEYALSSVLRPPSSEEVG